MPTLDCIGKDKVVNHHLDVQDYKMKHKGTQTLEADKVILRCFEMSDAVSMNHNLYSDSDVMLFLPWDVHAEISETTKHLQRYIDSYPKIDYYAWAITLKGTGEPIGFIDTVVDESISAIKIDYGIGKSWWHKGYTSDALSAVMRFFFDEVGANRVYATHDPRNPNSGKVMEKCGMKYEGTLRKSRYRKGEYSDRAMYSMLAEDYEKWGWLIKTGASYVRAPYGSENTKKQFENEDKIVFGIDDLQMIAEQGNPNAQNDLGIAFMTGNGVIKDAAKAVWYFSKAVEQQHTAACANLGICYADGIGIEKDMQMAIHLFAIAFRQARPGEINIESFFTEKIDISALEKLSANDDAQAQFFLGLCYADGKRVKQDRKKAWELYIKAAEQGEPLAQCMIGFYCTEGINVKRDLFRAEKIFKQAAELGAFSAWQSAVALRERIIEEAPYLLVKVTDKKWAESLLDGHVFMRALACFGDLSKRKAESNNAFRGDTLEGISASFEDGYNHYGYKVNADGNIDRDGTVGVIDALTLRKKVFCLFALEYDEVRGCYDTPDSQLRDFGDTAVVITDAEEFLRRVNFALSKKYGADYWWSCKRVSYSVDFSQSFKYSEFCKSRSYAWQNEFRISLDLSEGKFHPEILGKVTDYAKLTFQGKIEEDTREDSKQDDLLITIGSIRDICVAMPVSELLNVENALFLDSSTTPQLITEYDNKCEPRPTFLRRVSIIPIDGQYKLAFTTDWLDSAVM